MDIKTLTIEEFKKLKEFKPELKREANFYKINKNELFKCFLEYDEIINPNKLKESENIDYYIQKFKNIETLLKYREPLSRINELVLPKRLVKINKIYAGYIMDYIKSNSLLNILRNPKINFDLKIKYLIQIGELLEKIKQIKDFPYELHLNDLHEDNILVTKEKQIKLIDTDSIYISNNEPFCSQYLYCNPIIKENLINKYKKNKDGFVIPTLNSDIYCYVIIILNTLMREYSNKISLESFYNYLDYLEYLGFPYNFINSISKIYSEDENINPLPYLNELPKEKLIETHYKIYTQRTGKILN